MGQEVTCKAIIAGKRTFGRLQLESNKLMFRSPTARLDLSLQEVASAVAKKGVLQVSARGQTHRFQIGKGADRWVQRVTKPKSLVEKLGVKPEQKVAFVGAVDPELLAQVRTVTSSVSRTTLAKDYDWIFLGLEEPKGVSRLKKLGKIIAPKGGIWVIFPRGHADLKGENVIAAAKAAGLVDTKIARVSDRLTTMKLVIPLSRRI
jgi:hypothetical protein